VRQRSTHEWARCSGLESVLGIWLLLSWLGSPRDHWMWCRPLLGGSWTCSANPLWARHKDDCTATEFDRNGFWRTGVRRSSQSVEGRLIKILPRRDPVQKAKCDGGQKGLYPPQAAGHLQNERRTENRRLWAALHESQSSEATASTRDPRAWISWAADVVCQSRHSGVLRCAAATLSLCSKTKERRRVVGTSASSVTRGCPVIRTTKLCYANVSIMPL
jgi:hypothetical protein